MTQVPNKLKKPFQAHFGPIFPILMAIFFFWKIRLCHTQLHKGLQHYAKIQKKLMTQFQENNQTDGRTEEQKDRRRDRRNYTYPILQDPFGSHWGSNNENPFKAPFLKNITEIFSDSYLAKILMGIFVIIIIKNFERMIVFYHNSKAYLGGNIAFSISSV